MEFAFNNSFLDDEGAPLLAGISHVEFSICLWIIAIIFFSLISFLIYFYKKGRKTFALTIVSIIFLSSSSYSWYIFSNTPVST